MLAYDLCQYYLSKISDACSVWDIQDLPGLGPMQPAVGDPASAGGLD